MISFRRWVAVAILAFSACHPVLATDKADVDRVLSAGREDSKVMDHLDHLSNRIGARLTGSDNLQTACEWTRDQFKAFGLENAHLEQWGEFPVGFNRGPWTGRMVEPTSKPLSFGTNSWTAGTRGVVRGPVVMAPTNAEELEKMKDSLPGAWVLVPSGGLRGMFNARSEFPKTLAQAYKDAKIAGTIRGTRNDLILTGGNYQVKWDELPDTPAINLAKADYDEIAALRKDGKPVVLEFDIRNHFKKGPIPLSNVIADIPGTEFPDEYVIIGGHIDSWDGATGTTDNGTGCATTLEAARILMKSGVKPRRTIRFMLWSGEEQGLMGSRGYIKANPDLMKKISVVLVHDGGTNYLSGIGVTKAMKADADAIFAPLTELDPEMPFVVSEIVGLPRGIGSDHDSFLAAGVPGIFWRQKGKVNYNHAHHTQFDTYEIAIPEYQKHSSLVAALGALGMANLDHLLSRENLTAPGSDRNRRTIGVQLDELKVTETTEGSLAQKAGLLPNDVILQVDGKVVSTRQEFTTALQGTGRTRKLTVRRDGKDVELTIEFPAAP